MALFFPRMGGSLFSLLPGKYSKHDFKSREFPRPGHREIMVAPKHSYPGCWKKLRPGKGVTHPDPKMTGRARRSCRQNLRGSPVPKRAPGIHELPHPTIFPTHQGLSKPTRTAPKTRWAYPLDFRTPNRRSQSPPQPPHNPPNPPRIPQTQPQAAPKTRWIRCT